MLLVARSRVISLVVLVSALILLAPFAIAGTVSPNLTGCPSGDVCVFSNATGTTNQAPGTEVAVPVSPAWQAAGMGYSWISYNNTGCNTFVPTTGMCTPGPENPSGVTGPYTTANATAIFYQTFTLPTAMTGFLDVWADDTATVWIVPGTITSGDGTGISGAMLLASANPNPTPGEDCSQMPPGCIAGMDYQDNGLSLSAGTYTLVLDAYQYVGGSPFAVMYDSELSSSTGTPEPATYMLMSLGLAGLGVFVRRRRKN